MPCISRVVVHLEHALERLLLVEFWVVGRTDAQCFPLPVSEPAMSAMIDKEESGQPCTKSNQQDREMKEESRMVLSNVSI
jgi:hypothetical protein